MKEIAIYNTKSGGPQIEVQFEDDTVWLTQAQIVKLFESSKGNISEHTKNIFKEGELDPKQTVRKSRTVKNEGKRLISRELEYYNLDLILSIGYRVNSKKGTQFRQWATQRLKDHLIKGFTLNKKRLRQYAQNLQDLTNAIKLIEKSGKTSDLNLSEVKGLLEIISNYAKSFALLNRFDSDSFEEHALNEKITYEIKYKEALTVISELKINLINRKEASDLFGNQKDDSFRGILGNIIQSFGGQYLYPSIEEQAAHLLYFIIKNHPFSDGNKRIGAFLFVWFLQKNKHRFKRSGEVKINDNGLTALALLVAQSDPNDKDLMIKLIVNLIGEQ